MYAKQNYPDLLEPGLGKIHLPIKRRKQKKPESLAASYSNARKASRKQTKRGGK